MLRLVLSVAILSSTLLLTACFDDEVSELPPPAKLTMDATGYYCNMTVMDHSGSKGHVILNKDEEVFWFSSVRDTVAFTRMPGEPRNIAAIYVSDMSNVTDWAAPNLETWVEANDALFVIGSSKMGGMGAPEPVPFSDPKAADRFAKEFGGQVVNLKNIPNNFVLGTTDMDVQTSELHGDNPEEQTH